MLKTQIDYFSKMFSQQSASKFIVKHLWINNNDDETIDDNQNTQLLGTYP